MNLSLCDSTLINIYIPIELSGYVKQLYEKVNKSGYDMFNINDPFYQDICTPFDSLDETDILLTDRINYIYNNDDTQCQSNCRFSYYSIESQYLNCSCSTNENIKYDNLIKDKFSPKKLYESFYDVLKYSNYDILKCYKIVTNLNNIKSNIGCILTIVLFCCYLISLLIYIVKGINPLKIQLQMELKEQNGKNNFLFKSDIIDLLYPPIKKKLINKISPKLNKRTNDKIKREQNIHLKSKINISKKLNMNSNFGLKGDSSEKHISNKLKYLKMNSQNKYKKSDSKKAKGIVYSDYELNELVYEKAIHYDKRTLFQIYLANLKREHLIIFTFCNCNDYNLLSVKLSRFIFLIVGDMALNTFFFSDDSMHKLFLNYGKYNYIQQIPEITYSTILSSLIEIFLCFLSLTDKYFYRIKSNLIKGDKKNINKIIKCIKIKTIIYYTFIFIFFVLYWYIISVFCGVYRNTQIAFIKDSIISFTICLIYPLFFYFISSCLRVCSLRNYKSHFKCIYNLSYIIPLF